MYVCQFNDSGWFYLCIAESRRKAMVKFRADPECSAISTLANIRPGIASDKFTMRAIQQGKELTMHKDWYKYLCVKYLAKAGHDDDWIASELDMSRGAVYMHRSIAEMPQCVEDAFKAELLSYDDIFSLYCAIKEDKKSGNNNEFAKVWNAVS